MKSNISAKGGISVMALLMAVMMLFTACSGEEAKSSTVSNSSEQTADNSVNEDTSTPDNTSGISQPWGASNPLGNNESSNGADNDYADFDFSKAPKGEVHVLMWREYTETEQFLVSGFMKKTGINVRTTITTEKEYPTKLVSLVSGGDSPDVVQFNNQWFPGLVVEAMQPLDAKKFKLNSDCWYKTYMEPYKINGKYFGVAMNKSWSCEDCAYVTYYNTRILQQCGITTTPYQLYSQGKWNWEEQAKIAKQIAKAGKNYVGISVQSKDIFMYSAGADFATFDGEKYYNALNNLNGNSMLVKSWKTVAELGQDKVISDWDLNSIQQGKVGLFSAIAYGLYNEGAWFDNVTGGYGSLQAVPVAGPKGGTAYTPVRPKVWGVAKKAKNAAGAAYFLRYFLDVNNCNMSSTFYNKQFETVYNKITDKTAKKKIMVGMGIVDYVKPGTYSGFCGRLATSTPANITTVLNADKGTVNNAITKANKDLARIK